MKTQQFVKMDVHPITGFALQDYVFCKKITESKRKSQKKRQEIAKQKQANETTTTA